MRNIKKIVSFIELTEEMKGNFEYNEKIVLWKEEDFNKNIEVSKPNLWKLNLKIYVNAQGNLKKEEMFNSDRLEKYLLFGE